MAKKHDENQDVNIIGKRFKVNTVQKTIQASRAQIIGNKTWGRLDFLCHYCGYTLIWDSGEYVTDKNYSNKNKKQELRDAKKAAKEHKLSDKTKKSSNRK